MGKTPENIHPFNSFLDRASKEQLLKQRARVFWFTGLSGSGKTTIAKGLENELHLTLEQFEEGRALFEEDELLAELEGIDVYDKQFEDMADKIDLEPLTQDETENLNNEYRVWEALQPKGIQQQLNKNHALTTENIRERRAKAMLKINAIKTQKARLETEKMLH